MKVVIISSMLPSGHYSQYLTGGISSLPGIELIVYSDKNPANMAIRGCGQIKTVWSKSASYVLQIIRELKKDKPDIVHLQHEFNMYGGIVTAALFPCLLIILKILRYRVVVTVHAAIDKKQIDAEFIELFNKDSSLVRPIFLKVFFYYIYKSLLVFSNLIIVHTNLTKDILVTGYGTSASKISVIPIAIPIRTIKNTNKVKYFLYFGYMVRRKGLGFALEGFKKFLENNPGNSYKLILAGGVISGQEQAFEEIKSMISNFGLQNEVIIKGFVEENELDELYWNAEAVIIPAKISIAGSGPLFHAVSYGKYVIASKVGNLKEEIDHLKTGVLTDNDKWHEAFQFVADNPEQVSRIERAVTQKAATRTPTVIALMHREVYMLASQSGI